MQRNRVSVIIMPKLYNFAETLRQLLAKLFWLAFDEKTAINDDVLITMQPMRHKANIRRISFVIFRAHVFVAREKGNARAAKDAVVKTGMERINSFVSPAYISHPICANYISRQSSQACKLRVVFFRSPFLPLVVTRRLQSIVDILVASGVVWQKIWDVLSSVSWCIFMRSFCNNVAGRQILFVHAAKYFSNDKWKFSGTLTLKFLLGNSARACREDRCSSETETTQ